MLVTKFVLNWKFTYKILVFVLIFHVYSFWNVGHFDTTKLIECYFNLI